VYSLAVLTGVDLFALKFYVDRVIPINHSWRHKTRDTGLGLPDAEDRIFLRSLILTQYRSVTDGYAIAYTALAKLALSRAVKMLTLKLRSSGESAHGSVL